jgi:hypothetical protein
LQLFANAGTEPGGIHQLWAKSGGKWIVVEDRDLRWYPQNNAINCHFYMKHQLYPGGFYEVRWCRLDRGEFVEITREKFQLKNYAFGALTQPESRTG